MIGHPEKYAMVTGASSGIGYELSKLLAKDGKNLILVSRNRDKLEQVKTEIENRYGNQVRVLPCDLARPRGPQEIFIELEKENLSVDVLVNNAGFGIYGMFAETELQAELEMIQLNIVSSTYLTKLLVKKMLEDKSGWILNVSSTLGCLPVPLLLVYAATKAYLLHFSEGLACELQGSGVNVTCLCPQPTRTLFWSNMEHAKSSKMNMLDAATVAGIGYKALKKGKTVANAGILANSLPFLLRIAPRNSLIKMMKSSA